MHRLNEADMENERYQYDLGELLVQYQDPFKTTYQLSPGQEKVFADLIRCRTSALGGHQGNRWRGIGAPHLGTSSHIPSAYSYDHSGRRTIGRQDGMDCLP